MEQEQISVREDKDNIGLKKWLQKEAKAFKRSFSNHVLFILAEYKERKDNE